MEKGKTASTVKESSFCLLITKMIKQTVVIVQSFPYYQLRTRLYPTFVCRVLLHMYKNVWPNISIDIDLPNQLLIIISHSSNILEKREYNGLYIRFFEGSSRPMIHLRGRFAWCPHIVLFTLIKLYLN
jgi:hypothetical protein